MVAQCAICLQPIPRGGKFVLAGTEVFHDMCAAQQGTHTSVGNQRRQRLAYLESHYAEYKRSLENYATEHRLLKDKIVKEQEHLVQQVEDAQAGANSWRRRFETTRTDLERATAERDQARRELAVARQYGVDHQAAAPEQKPDQRDATEIRFSLLEIDPD